MTGAQRCGRAVLAAHFGWTGLMAVTFLLGPDYAVAQCALCRDAVVSSSAETREAMNYAIMSLAAAPYAVAALAAWALSPALRTYVRAWFRNPMPKKTGAEP